MSCMPTGRPSASVERDRDRRQAQQFTQVSAPSPPATRLDRSPPATAAPGAGTHHPQAALTAPAHPSSGAAAPPAWRPARPGSRQSPARRLRLSSARCISSVPAPSAPPAPALQHPCERPRQHPAEEEPHSSLARRSPRCSNGSTGKPHCSAIRAPFPPLLVVAGCTGTSQNCGQSPMRSPAQIRLARGTGARKTGPAYRSPRDFKQQAARLRRAAAGRPRQAEPLWWIGSRKSPGRRMPSGIRLRPAIPAEVRRLADGPASSLPAPGEHSDAIARRLASGRSPRLLSRSQGCWWPPHVIGPSRSCRETPAIRLPRWPGAPQPRPPSHPCRPDDHGNRLRTAWRCPPRRSCP